MIKKTKTEYYARQIKNTPFNSKDMWKTLNTVVNNRMGKRENRDPKSISVKGETITNKKNIVEIFNQHYINITESIKREFEEVTEERREPNSLIKCQKDEKKSGLTGIWQNFHPVTPHTVKKSNQ